MQKPEDEFIASRGDKQLPAEPDRQGASDMRQASLSREAQQLAPLGTPPADYGVRSVYDSRPVSGQDFNQYLQATEIFSPHTGITVVTSTFTVPQGYTAVLRTIETWVEPIPTLTTRDAIEISAQVNGADDRFTRRVPVGSGTLDPIKTFILADELSTVGLAWIFNVALSPGSYNFNALLYGNLLLKTGRPYQFEIANYAGSGQLAVTPGMPQAVMPGQSSPGVMAGTMPVALGGLSGGRHYVLRRR